LKIEDIGGADRHVTCVHFRDALLDQEQLIGMAVGQRPQQNSVDDAKNRGVRADAGGERDDGDRREGGFARNVRNA
jgi:hypothetical protein